MAPEVIQEAGNCFPKHPNAKVVFKALETNFPSS